MAVVAKRKSRFRSYRLSRSISQIVINAILMVLSLLFLVPMILVISSSLTDEVSLSKNGYNLFPSKFSLDAYKYIIADPARILSAYSVTITVTIIGTVVGLLLMSLLAYALSRRDFQWRKPISFMVFFTMLFNGGLVPTYYLVTQVLHLKNTLPVLILPYLIVPWFIFILRTFFATLPTELIEAARIDGAGEWRIFFQLVLPLSTPVLATVGLFCVLMYWNDWWLPLLYVSEPKLFPLQYLLYSIMRNAEFLTSGAAQRSGMVIGVAIPTQTLRMAMVVVAMGPIAVVFLALQRYFVRGMLIGSLKG
jgi:putative aldouronate transport system permease protein